jgi:hypothetical protein
MPYVLRLAGVGWLAVAAIGCATRPQEALIEPTYTYQEAAGETPSAPAVAVVETERGD